MFCPASACLAAEYNVFGMLGHNQYRSVLWGYIDHTEALQDSDKSRGFVGSDLENISYSEWSIYLMNYT